MVQCSISPLLGGDILHNAHLDQTSPHPILLDRKSLLMRLLLLQLHISYSRAVPTTILALVAEDFHIVCVKLILWFLHHLPAGLHYQQMYQLPNPRFQCTLPFFETGGDFAGPQTVHDAGRVLGVKPVRSHLASDSRVQ